MNSETHLFEKLHAELKRAKRVLLVAHKKPDGDTLGSSSSMLNWLLREGKDVRAFCLDTPPPAFRYLDSIHRYTTDPKTFEEMYDVIIVFDSGDLRYCGVDTFISNLPQPYLLVNIDHHETNTRFGHLNLVFTDASSTAEVVYRFFEASMIQIDSRMATSLLTGVLTDTSHFSNAATTPISIEAAGKLLACGARFTDILKYLQHNKSIPLLRLWGVLLSRLQYNPTYDVVSTYILKNDLPENGGDIVEGMSNFLNGVTQGTDTILVLRELTNGQIKGSLRSVKRDISKFAKLIGGGGHKKAAGFTIKGQIEVTPEGPRIRS